ncbi:hypothetical protein BJ170DRAFT_601975 [Xylariales sp. AK1849]|nr:hypothetical protein BJ170DRAFT_601975 [Xylariales sp. AK1849]
MEPTLEDKGVFFDRLQSLQDDDDSDETNDINEDAHRAKCKAFNNAALNTTGPRSRSTFPGTSNPRADAPRRTASDPMPNQIERTEVIIIKDTPQPRKCAPLLAKTISSLEDTPIPDSTTRPSSQPSRKLSNTKLRKTSRTSSLTEDSPSTTMGKRKRPELKMAPEVHQCFKRLSFFYIPNDDIDPARKRRITRAREHGAEWARKLDEATHVIVDKKLNYIDIEKILASSSTSADKTIVNDEYPLDCLTYRKVVNPNQNRYRVPGFPQTAHEADATTSANDSSQITDKSLQLKPKHNKPGKWDYVPPAATPPRGDGSTQQSTGPSLARVITSSQLGSQLKLNSAPDDDSRHGGQHPQADAGVRREKEVSPNDVEAEVDGDSNVDELTEYIDFARLNPEAGLDNKDRDDDDGDGRLSDVHPDVSSSSVGADGSDVDTDNSDEEQPNKRRRSGKAPKPNQLDATWQDKFACMKGSTKEENPDNPNASTIAKLQEMCDWYSRNNEQWRIKAYRGAISALRQQDTKITTFKQARSIFGIGDRLASKIEEIVRTGQLQRLEYARREPNHEIRELFLGIYDVGLERADKWIAKGHRTLEDLMKNADLSKNQRIGIEHYDDLHTRIPRREVEALGTCVKKAAAGIDSRVELLIGGSYRRGSDSSGDIDFIVTKKGTRSTSELTPFLDQLVRKLLDDGFLTVGLATSRSPSGSKWHGCCVLPKADFPGDKADYRPIWRRIDFLLVPETEFGASLIYFTGNDLFNRSMRLLASKKGMNLSQRGLYRGVMRGSGGIKLNDGELVEGRDEKKIFDALGVHWREPHERWC